MKTPYKLTNLNKFEKNALEKAQKRNGAFDILALN